MKTGECQKEPLMRLDLFDICVADMEHKNHMCILHSVNSWQPTESYYMIYYTFTTNATTQSTFTTFTENATAFTTFPSYTTFYHK